MPLLSLADFDKSLKLNQLLCTQLNPLLNTTNNLLNAQLNLLTAESILNANNKQTSYSRYKTELCRQFSENGQCKYGDKCQFAHGLDELKDVKRHPKYKTDFCKTFHSKGFCPYGPRCHFIHELNEKFEQSPNMTQVNKVPNSNNNSVNKSKMNENQIDRQIEAIQSQITSSLLLNIKNEIEAEKDKKKVNDCQEDSISLFNMTKKDDLTNSGLYKISENGSFIRATSCTDSFVSNKPSSVSLNASPSSTSSSTSSLSMGLDNGIRNGIMSDQFENDLFSALNLRTNMLSPLHQEMQTPIRTRSSVSSTSSSFSTISSNTNVSSNTSISATFDFYNNNNNLTQNNKSNLSNNVLNLNNLANFNATNASNATNDDNFSKSTNKYLANYTQQIIW